MHPVVTPLWHGPAVELFVLGPDSVGDAYVEWLNDPAIARYLESRFARHDADSTRAYAASVLASADSVLLGIRSVALGRRHVGNIKLGPINRQHGTADIGIMIGDRAAWGRGIATAAIAMLAEIAREELGLRKLTAGCYASNGGSERAFLKAGFAREGVRPGQFLLDGKPEDLVLMGRLLAQPAGETMRKDGDA